MIENRTSEKIEELILFIRNQIREFYLSIDSNTLLEDDLGINSNDEAELKHAIV